MSDLERPTISSLTSKLNLIPNYSKYKPKINLEILTSRNATTMLVLTYFMLFACLAGSISISLFVHQNVTRYAYPEMCSNCSNTSLPYSTSFNFINPISNIVTFQMQVTQTNFSSLIGWTEDSKPNVCSAVSLKYNTKSWACFNNNGCLNFTSEQYSGENTNEYFLIGNSDVQTIITNMCALRTSSDGFTLDVIPEVFHIQVSMRFLFFFICRNLHIIEIPIGLSTTT